MVNGGSGFASLFLLAFFPFPSSSTTLNYVYKYGIVSIYM